MFQRPDTIAQSAHEHPTSPTRLRVTGTLVFAMLEGHLKSSAYITLEALSGIVSTSIVMQRAHDAESS